MPEITIFNNDKNIQIFEPGAILFNVGELDDSMYAVVAGEVEMLLNGKVVDTVRAGGLFGEMALIDDSPRSATAVVKSQAKIVPISKKQFLYMVQQTPYFSIQVMQIVAERLRRLMSLQNK